MEVQDLIKKYNVPGPRYTSYPTVPYWDESTFSYDGWEAKVLDTFDEARELSLYIHLPYCESMCTFCGCNTRITVNHKVETPYIETVLKEWELYQALMKVKPVIRELHLGGGTPTFFSPENLKKLIDGILEKVSLAPDAQLGFEGHPNNTTKEHLQVLYDLGFRRVSFGIQDFDPIVQDAINRIQTYDKVAKVTEVARAIGYTSINYDIVYGLPLQQLQGVVDTIHKVTLLKPDRIAFYSYAHVPWIKPGQRKYTEQDIPSDDAKRQLYDIGRAMLEEAGYVEIGMDHFALPTDELYLAAQQKTLHRNFMGYTTTNTDLLIGLGVSSISDLKNAYAQNVKSIEEYKHLVEEGMIPVFRGHFLTHDDQLLKQHILNVMCRLETSWSKAEEQSDVLLDGLNRLLELEQDGLIQRELYSIKVTDLGKPFVRNIGMALDARMHARTAKDVQFSKVI